MRNLWALAGTALCLAVLAAGAQGATLLVPGQYLQIQDAMDVAVAGDEIVVAPGVYSDTTHFAHPPDDMAKCVVVFKSGVTLRGSGMGSTIIDGAYSAGPPKVGARGIHIQNATNVTIVGLTVRNCFNGWNDVYGAGIFFKNSSGSLLNVEFTGNHDGALTCVDGSSPQVDWCVMDDNEAKSGGGLFVNTGCAPILYGCRITNNHAPFAAGIHMRGNATLDHCIISGNATTGAGTVLGGGLLVIDGANPLIVDCDITDNVCSGNGAGIAFVGDGTQGTLLNSMVLDNVSTGVEGRGAGISVESQSGPVIRSSVIARNQATGEFSDGGGVYVQYSSVTIENCTLDANGAAGSFSLAGNLGLETSLFVPSTMQVTHTILSHSPDGQGVYCAGTGTDPTVACCDIFGNAEGNAACGVGSDNFSQDPQLCDPASDNYHIGLVSPCAPGLHPNGPQACGGLLIGAREPGCNTGVDEPPIAVSRLLASRPNPFDRQTTIALTLPEPAPVTLEVIDPAGRSVALLHQGSLDAGEHRFAWDGRRTDGSLAGSGVFFARVKAGERMDAIRMLRLQ